MFAQAADALAYAHSQGVIHRDVKPGNLLLDANGTLWVADFGLAKAIEHEDLTQAGDVVGTLRYMAPEQFHGEGDERSDVYSLGITLYELSLLRPAFVESRGNLVRAVTEQPLFPPRRLRPDLPADLETIILKATAREPQHRYASAAAFRDDLLRFAEDRPIAARRVSLSERLWRWSRRNPALATTSGVALGLLVAITAISLGAYVHVRRANTRAREALAGETAQRQRFENTARLAVEALDEMFDEFAPRTGLAARDLTIAGSDDESVTVTVTPNVSAETAAFLERMLPFYQRLATQEGDSGPLQLKAAAAQRRVGEIHEYLGRHAEAAAAYDSAIRQYEALDSGKFSPSVQLAETRNQLARALMAQDRLPEAYKQLQSSYTSMKELRGSGAATPEARLAFARSCYLLARPPVWDDPVKSDARPLLGPPGRGRPAADPPPREGSGAGPPARREPDGGWPPSGGMGRHPGRHGERLPFSRPAGPFPGPSPDERLACFDAAVTTLRELALSWPDRPEYRHLLAQCLRDMPPPFFSLFGLEKTSPLQQSITLLQELVTTYPNEPQYRLDLAEALSLQDRGPDARERLQEAIGMLETLVQEHPASPTHVLALAHANLKMSRVLARERDADGELTFVRKAVNLQAGLAERHPGVPTYQLAMAFYESTLARCLGDRDRLDEARPLFESAARRLDSAAATDGFKPHIRQLAGRTYRDLARLYARLGDTERAEQSRRRSDAFARPPAASKPAWPDTSTQN